MKQTSAGNKTICFFNSNIHWGGGEKWHFDMARYLVQKGFSVIICAAPDSALFEKAKSSGIPVYGFYINNLSFLNPFLHFRIRKFFQKQKVTHLVINLPSDLKAAGIAAHKTGVQQIIYRRGSAKPIKNSFLNRYLFKNIIHHVIANSQETKKTILHNNGNLFPKEKITVIYNGIDVSEYNLPEEAKSRGNIIIGTAGRLSKEKGHKRLLDIASLLKKRNLPFTLKIAGIGPEEHALKQKVHQLALEDHVRLEGFINPFADFLKQIDVFVLPSYYEGFGYVLVEAMAAQKPVLSFDIGASKEIICEGKNGYIIADNNNEKMAEKLITLAKDPELRKQLGRQGKQIVHDKFSFETMYDRFIQTLDTSRSQ